jgi:hypothetical protein
MLLVVRGSQVAIAGVIARERSAYNRAYINPGDPLFPGIQDPDPTIEDIRYSDLPGGGDMSVEAMAKVGRTEYVGATPLMFPVGGTLQVISAVNFISSDPASWHMDVWHTYENNIHGDSVYAPELELLPWGGLAFLNASYEFETDTDSYLSFSFDTANVLPRLRELYGFELSIYLGNEDGDYIPIAIWDDLDSADLSALATILVPQGVWDFSLIFSSYRSEGFSSDFASARVDQYAASFDFSLVPVPEPSMLVLAAFGAVALSIHLRRRRF